MSRDCSRCATYTLYGEDRGVEDFYQECVRNSWRDRRRPETLL